MKSSAGRVLLLAPGLAAALNTILPASAWGLEPGMSPADFLRDNCVGVILGITAVFAAVVLLLWRRLKEERRINNQLRESEEALRRELGQRDRFRSATRIAYTDPLTGVKSKHAFAEAEELLDRRIAEGEVSAFAAAFFDLNVSDSLGREASERFIREVSAAICARFTHSPVYRVGGDAFVAILEGEDYERRDELLGAFEKEMDGALAQGKPAVAAGCARFDPTRDRRCRAVLERAEADLQSRRERTIV